MNPIHPLRLTLLTSTLFLFLAASPSPSHPGAATKPAVDHGSPAKTWAALCAAVKSGDLLAFRACCYNKNEVSRVFMDAYSDTVVTSFQLAAAVAQLGDEGKAISKSLESTYTDLLKSGQNRTLVIKAGNATWTQTVATAQGANAEQVMYFKEVGTDWLLDTEQSYNLNTAEGRKSAEAFIADSDSALKLLKSVIADIKSKKITTVKEMREKMAAK